MSHRLIFTNNTKLNDTNYVPGSGVGAKSISVRRALKDRTSVICSVPPPPPFVPTDLPNFLLWLDANDPAGTGIKPADGALNTWIDKSGNGKNMTAAQTTPTFSNTANAVVFPAIGYYKNTTVVFNNAYTAFFVFKSSNIQGMGPLYTTAAAGGTGISGIFPNENNTTTFQTLGNNNWYINNNNIFKVNVMNLATVSYSDNVIGSDVLLYSNGVVIGNNTLVNPITYNSLNIGARFTGPNLDGTFKGNMYEVIGYSGVLTNANRIKVENYLRGKWNI